MSNSTKATKVTPLSLQARTALDIIRGAETPMTLAQINALSSEPIVAAHLTTLSRRGLVSAVKTEFVCACCGNKTERNVYSVTDAGAVYVEQE